MSLNPALEARVTEATGRAVEGMWRVASRGYTNTEHWIARLDDGRTVFVKSPVNRALAEWLRREHAVYQQLRGPWAPGLLGWHDDGERPVLVLEDLSDCTCAPPWTPERVDGVLATLAEVAGHPVPNGLPWARDGAYAEGGWPEIARDPRPFLALGLCTAEWLERALPVLMEAAAIEHVEGSALLHLDVRSDNLFFRGPTAVLVDWNLAAAGNPEFDVASWLPSLQMEGGPAPESVRRVPPGIVALVAGFFASRAGRPIISAAPRVRDVQRRQLEVALPWAARALDLPPV